MGSQLQAGYILWVKPCTVQAELDRYGITEAATNHPCLVIKPTSNTESVTICIITSRHGKNINNEAYLPANFRQRYLPIHPQSRNEAVPGVMLYLEDGLQMGWLSYVHTAKVYHLPSGMLKKYENFKKPTVVQYRLDAASMQAVLFHLPVQHHYSQESQNVSSLGQPPPYTRLPMSPAPENTPLFTLDGRPAPSYGTSSGTTRVNSPINASRPAESASAASDLYTPPSPVPYVPNKSVARSKSLDYGSLARKAANGVLIVTGICITTGILFFLGYASYLGYRGIVAAVTGVARHISAAAHSVGTFFTNIGHGIVNMVHAATKFFSKVGHGIGGLSSAITKFLKMILEKFRGTA